MEDSSWKEGSPAGAQQGGDSGLLQRRSSSAVGAIQQLLMDHGHSTKAVTPPRHSL
jgi:hypothetical protein